MGSWKKAGGKSPEDRLDETAAFITAAMQRIERQSQAGRRLRKELRRPGQARPGPGIQAVAKRQGGRLAGRRRKLLAQGPRRSCRHRALHLLLRGPAPGRATTGARSCAPTTTPPPIPPIWPPPSTAPPSKPPNNPWTPSSWSPTAATTPPATRARAPPPSAMFPFTSSPSARVEMPRDAILHHVHAPRAVFKNDTAVIDAMITAYSCEGEQLQVQLPATASSWKNILLTSPPACTTAASVSNGKASLPAATPSRSGSSPSPRN
jgi:hypothetical protein